jgi:hypothetical protein
VPAAISDNSCSEAKRTDVIAMQHECLAAERP